MFQLHLATRRLRRLLSKAVRMNWLTVFVATVTHAIASWWLLHLVGETRLVDGWGHFAYWFIATGSTVGYGDITPDTDAGKLVVALWAIPGAVTTFALVIGKIAGTIAIAMRKTMNGLGNFSDKSGHIVIVGYVAGQTEKLLEETRRLHGSRDVVVVCTDDLTERQGDWNFIRTASLSRREDLVRAGVCQADFVVILSGTDDESLAGCLAVWAQNPKGHIVGYFREEDGAELVRSHCPGIEIVTSISTEQVARALSDPGAGQLLQHLVSTRYEGTLCSLHLNLVRDMTVSDVSEWMRTEHSATLIAL